MKNAWDWKTQDGRSGSVRREDGAERYDIEWKELMVVPPPHHTPLLLHSLYPVPLLIALIDFVLGKHRSILHAIVVRNQSRRFQAKSL